MESTSLSNDSLRATATTDLDVWFTIWGSLAIALVGTTVAAITLRQIGSVFEVPVFYHQFVLHDLPGSLLSAAIILVAMLSFRRFSAPLRILDLLDRQRYLIAASLVILLAVGTLTIYHNHPLTADEFAQLFQAKIFAKGKIWTRYPPELIDWLLPFSEYGFFRPGWVEGQIITDYWPGFSLLETPFVFLGIPWLLNPLLAAGSLLLIRQLAAKLYPDSNAPSWAMLFTLASPAFIVNAISYHCLPAILFLNLLFTILLLRHTLTMLLLAGVVGSLALVQKNPLPHMLYATPWIIWLIARRGGWRNLIPLAIGYAPLSLLIGVGWALLRSDIGTQAPSHGNTVYEAPWRILSFLSLTDFAIVLYWRAIALLKCAAWAAPGLIVLACLGARHCWADTRVRLLSASLVFSFGGYLLFKAMQGHGWGYRHIHGAWAVLPVLACGAVATNGKALAGELNSLRNLAAILTLASLLALNGVRLFQVDAWMGRHLAQLPPLDPHRRQICLIRPWEGYYSIDLVQNDPFFEQPTLFLKSHGVETEQLFMETHFPNAIRSGSKGESTVWAMPSGSGGKMFGTSMEYIER